MKLTSSVIAPKRKAKEGQCVPDSLKLDYSKFTFKPH